LVEVAGAPPIRAMQSLKAQELNCRVAPEHFNKQQNTDRVGLS
jgi:hypothetical protein